MTKKDLSLGKLNNIFKFLHYLTTSINHQRFTIIALKKYANKEKYLNNLNDNANYKPIKTRGHNMHPVQRAGRE